MKEIKFRDLKPEEIEVRVGNIIKDKSGNPTSFNLMLYKTARADMTLLDEAYGIGNWQCRYYQVKNTMVCSISIWDEDKKQWIEKCDGGDDDFNTEQIKAELSDSFKRAGFRVLPPTRKLYSASKLYLVVKITETNTTKSRYEVSDIAYDDTSITSIKIINSKTKEVVVDTKAKKTQPKTKTEEQPSEDLKVVLNYLASVPASKHDQLKEWFYRAVGKREINLMEEEDIKYLAKKIREKVVQ